MKKTTSICLFTGMIFLLLVMVVYLLFIQQDTGEKEQDLAAATEKMPAEIQKKNLRQQRVLQFMNLMRIS